MGAGAEALGYILGSISRGIGLRGIGFIVRVLVALNTIAMNTIIVPLPIFPVKTAALIAEFVESFGCSSQSVRRGPQGVG